MFVKGLKNKNKNKNKTLYFCPNIAKKYELLQMIASKNAKVASWRLATVNLRYRRLPIYWKKCKKCLTPDKQISRINKFVFILMKNFSKRIENIKLLYFSGRTEWKRSVSFFTCFSTNFTIWISQRHFYSRWVFVFLFQIIK